MSAPGRVVPDVSGLLAHTSHVLSTRMTAAFAELGISPRGYCVLFHALESERTQAELAELAGLDKTTMVVTVDGLEKLGLAERRPSSADRRARIIAVTTAGKRAVRRGGVIADQVHREVLDALGGKADGFVEALTRLTEGHLATPVKAPVRRPRQRRA
jgi:MarR family transcriptional regulator, transcriptional regulator for hemolysin